MGGSEGLLDRAMVLDGVGGLRSGVSTGNRVLARFCGRGAGLLLFVHALAAAQRARVAALGEPL